MRGEALYRLRDGIGCEFECEYLPTSCRCFDRKDHLVEKYLEEDTMIS